MLGVERLQAQGSYVPPAMMLLGLSLFLTFLVFQVIIDGVESLLSTVNVLSYAFSLTLGGVVAGVGLQLARSELDRARHRRILQWSVGAGFVLFLLNLPLILVVDGMDTMAQFGWAHGVFSTGAAAGAVIGYIEAKAIERERRAERTRIEAKAAERERERLDYLNGLLRHEILNNVQVLVGIADRGRRHCEGSGRRYFADISRKSEDMTRVVKDVRTLIQAVQNDGSLDTVDLASTVESEVADVEATFEDVEIETVIADDVRVVGDQLLRRVFGNLLANAIEHNDSDVARVTLTVETSGETVEIRVSDNGPGVPETERSTLFERGTAGDHGLGLYLVRVLVERSNGTIELSETGEDGSVFTVELPRVDANTGEIEPEGASEAGNHAFA